MLRSKTTMEILQAHNLQETFDITVIWEDGASAILQLKAKETENGSLEVINDTYAWGDNVFLALPVIGQFTEKKR